MMLRIRRHRVVMTMLSALMTATVLFCLAATPTGGRHGIIGASAAIAAAPAPSGSTSPDGPPWG